MQGADQGYREVHEKKESLIRNHFSIWKNLIGDCVKYGDPRKIHKVRLPKKKGPKYDSRLD